MLKGKTAIVTGASRGIGRAIALKFAQMGANIAVVYAGNHAAAQETAAACREQGVRVKEYCCDVADFEAAKQTVEAVKAEFGGVQILVNNAGVTRDGLIARMKEEEFDAVLDVNLKGAFNMTRHCAGLNISSVSGLMGNAGQCNYSASKAGLIGLTKSTAKELASRGVRCNAIAPGFIRTDMTRSQEENPMLGLIPLGRMGDAEEVAEAAAYLAAANYVTGEVLRVDGGIAM